MLSRVRFPIQIELNENGTGFGTRFAEFALECMAALLGEEVKCRVWQSEKPLGEGKVVISEE